MRKLLIILAVAVTLLVLFCRAFVFAGEGDVSMNVMTERKQSTLVIPWMTYDTGRFLVDVRSNFDWSGAPSIFIGKSFQKNDSMIITPAVGVVWSEEYKATSAELYIENGGKVLSWITMNEMTFGTEKDSPSFAYHWTEALWKVTERLQVGFGEQLYWEWSTSGADAVLDLGPVIGVDLSHGVYVKLWGMKNPTSGSEKLFATIGTSF